MNAGMAFHIAIFMRPGSPRLKCPINSVSRRPGYRESPGWMYHRAGLIYFQSRVLASKCDKFAVTPPYSTLFWRTQNQAEILVNACKEWKHMLWNVSSQGGVCGNLSGILLTRQPRTHHLVQPLIWFLDYGYQRPSS